MHEPNKNIEARVLSLLDIHDINDSEAAFQIVVNALATICRTLKNGNLRTAVYNIGFPLADSFGNLSSNEFAFLNKLVNTAQESLKNNDIDNIQVSVQKLISSPMRKRLAAYYTKSIGLELMAQLAGDFVRAREAPIVLADPFLGSGLSVTTTLKHLDASAVRKVWGVEPHPLPALVAFSAILSSLKGDYTKIDISVGDVFENVCRSLRDTSANSVRRRDGGTLAADIIVTNPPFTRWELLGGHYRNFLWNSVESLGYFKYVTRRQLNLQVASLFLMDHVLEDNGLLVSVLPASTFYTLYGEAAKSLLAEKYQINALIESESDTSFSIDSGLKEVILLAIKRKPTERNKTAFATLESRDVEHIRRIGEALGARGSVNNSVTWIDLKEEATLSQANWSVFFANAKLRETMSKVLSRTMKNETIGTWDAIYGEESIVRGVEMYGPDFFFIPNRYWAVTEEHKQEVSIENHEDELRLSLPKEYLIPALRKPGLYLDTIRPTVEHYLLSIPPRPVKEFPEDLAKYVDWGKRRSTGQPAIRLFGDLWYSHVNKQLRVKKPFGRVFLPDKVDPSFRNRGLFASYYDKPLAASKNFHIVTLNDDSKDKLLVAWFNSTLFISYFILTGRKITRSWSRLLEDNYLRMPIINLNSISRRDTAKLEKAFKSILEQKLPPMKKQLDADYRHQIDKILLEVMGIEDPEKVLSQVYSALGPNLR